MARTKDDNISLTWVVSFVAVVAVVLELATPETVVQTIPGAEAVSTLVSDAMVLTAALAVGVGIFVWWIVSARLVGDRTASTASGTAERVEQRFENFVSEWITVGRLVVSSFVVIGFALLGEFGTLLGDFAGLLAQVPVVVSQLVTVGLGWVALGGNVPVIGTLFATMTPEQWALIGLVLLGLGVAIKNA